MINVEIRNPQGTTLSRLQERSVTPIVGDVINLDPQDEAAPRRLKVIEREWHGHDLLVITATTEF